LEIGKSGDAETNNIKIGLASYWPRITDTHL